MHAIGGENGLKVMDRNNCLHHTIHRLHSGEERCLHKYCENHPESEPRESPAHLGSGKECFWWKSFLKPFKLAQETITLHEDNQTAITLSKNPQFHDRTNNGQISLDTRTDLKWNV